MRELNIDEWDDLATELTAWVRGHPDAGRADIDQVAEDIERGIRAVQVCAAQVTVRLGQMSASDLACARRRVDHGPRHGVVRHFQDVRMTADWAGEFEE